MATRRQGTRKTSPSSLSPPLSHAPSGKLTFHLFGALAEFERDLIRQRVNAGLKAARARGRLGSRKPKLKENDIEKARVLLASGKYSMGKVAKELQVRSTMLWRAVSKVAVG